MFFYIINPQIKTQWQKVKSMAIIFNLESYENASCSEELVNNDASINENSEIHFTYDGGRLNVYIDNKEVFSSMLAGNDFSLNLAKGD